LAEILEFDLVHTYSIFKAGISVDVTLRNGAFSIDVDTKIDTGSTYCIFERYYAERLDFEVESGTLVELSTATGSFRAYGHELTLSVMGIENVSTVYFAESEHFERNVLGRIGWLDRVKLGLIEREGKLFLSRDDG
jgi:predicted aspartyl protease